MTDSIVFLTHAIYNVSTCRGKIRKKNRWRNRYMKNTAKTGKLLLAPAVTLAGMIALSGVAAPAGTFVHAASEKESSLTKYTSEYGSKAEAMEAGLELNYQIAAEGAVLLKNENAALPIKITETETPAAKPGDEPTVTRSGNKISVFGYGSIAPNGGGSVNDAEASAGTVTFDSTFYSSFEDAKFEVNPKLKGMYEGYLADKTVNGDADIDMEQYSLPSFEKSYENYADAAVIILGNTSKKQGETGHALQYGEAQKALVNFVTEKFDKVIVLINKSVPMEIDWLKKNDSIDAILLIGEAGTNGLDVTGHLLNGDINPSGRLVDTYAVDQTATPSYVNYNKLGIADMMDMMGTGNDTYKTYKLNDAATNTYFVEYEEGIYVGYRYWETRGYEEGGKTDNWEWYNNHVSYTFGHGLSYTNFSWELLSSSTPAGAIQADGTIRFDIKVTNSGTVAGKDVVELYYTAPYKTGEIEKSYVELGAFAKTGELKPGESETVSLTIKVEDMSSYDYNDANKNQNQGYELDKGDYVVRLARSAHDFVESRTYTLGETANVKSESKNLFEDSNVYADNKFSVKKGLSRANFAGTMPTAVTEDERTKLSAEEYEKFKPVVTDDSNDVMPTQANAATRPEVAEIKLADLAGKTFDDPMWEQLLNQLTVEEMVELFNNGGFHSEALDYIGKPYSLDTDGPLGWTGTGVSGVPYNRFASEPVIASTWNVELAEEMGVMIGEQGLWGSSDRTDGAGISAYTGWYAPGMNLHRSAFDARYTEYYSEDGFLMGKIVAGVSRGLNSKGGYLFIKHFALHNDGAGVFSYRGQMGSAETGKTAGMAVWASEQTMREIYFQAYELAVKEGKARAAMSAFNRIGYTWAGCNKALLTDLLRGEWGFKGFVITDIAIYKGMMDGDAMVRAGGDLVLSGGMGVCEVTDKTTTTATGVKALRNATKNILWTVLNANAMGAPCGAKVVLNANKDFVNTAKTGSAYSATLGGEDLAELNTLYAYDEITYTATGLPAGLSIDSKTGVVSGTPTEAGAFDITVTASANGYESATRNYTLFVSGEGGTSGGCNSSIGFGSAIIVTLGLSALAVTLLAVRRAKSKND